MSRAINGTLLTELLATSFRPAVLYEGTFQYNTLRLWSGVGDLSWSGQTWLGNGWLGVPDFVEESVEVEANTCTIILMGVPQTAISLILSNSQRGATGLLYLGALNSSGAVTGTPYLAFKGKLDQVDMDEGEDTASILLSYESDLIDLERARSFRYTKQSQSNFYSDDLGFDYVPMLQDDVYWGNKKHKNKNKAHGGGKRNRRGK